VLVTYDVNTEDNSGKRRLRQVAKQCEKFGQRVQCSVFECSVDMGQCKLLQARLLDIMDMNKDSLRFYYLGNHYQTRIDHFGMRAGYRPDENLIL
jgi:CRISPR-associated protein Cas2